MQNEEIIEGFETSNEVSEGTDDGTETTEGNGEVSEASQQNNETGTDGEALESVSDGDSSIVEYDKQIDDIINKLIYQREQMDSLQAYLEAKDMTIFEKPLEKYTVTEGLLLITFFVIVFMALIKLVGGIITCKV